MHKNIYIAKIISIVITILTFSHPLFSQQNDETDNKFKLAVSLYQSGEYKDALNIFKKIAIQLPDNPNTTAAYLFTGKTYLQLNNLDSAGFYLQDFMVKYPQSNYKDEAKLSLVKVLYLQENYAKAFAAILDIIGKGSPEYKTYASSVGEMMALNNIELKDLKNYSDTISTSSVKPYILLVIGEKEKNSGNYSLASETLKKLVSSYTGSGEAEKAEDLINDIENQKKKSVSSNLLAVLLPLNNDQTGEKITAAHEILEGIKYAVSGYNSEHQKQVGLIIRDTGNDSLKIAVIKDEISTNPSIEAIIGPIFSNEVRYTLIDFKASGIPVISPTATDNDLTDISNYFFQANPSFSMRGKVMAQYIYYVTARKNIGVLNSDNGYSHLLADAFIAEYEKIGGNIVVHSTYSSGSINLNQPVAAIAADSEKIDGIYLPLSSKTDASALLSQMVQQNINVPIFGNQDWFYTRGFESSSALSDQLSFTSDFYIDYNDTSFNSISKEFVAQTGVDINRNVLYGYDTAEYLLTLINAGAESRSSLINAMETGIEVKGYHNNIAFGKGHVNKFMNIIRYIDGKFELVDRFNSGE